MKNHTEIKIYKLGNKLGLSNIDIENIIENSSLEQVYFSSGPPWYPGNRYGTVSIKDL